MAKLTAKECAGAKDGKHSDGEGLALYVKGKSKAWVLRYRYAGAGREMGLGKFPNVSLADARRARDEALELLTKGIDPLEQRRSAAVSPKVAAITFLAAAEIHIAAKVAKESQPKNAMRWRSILRDYSRPVGVGTQGAIRGAYGEDNAVAMPDGFWRGFQGWAGFPRAGS